MGKSGDWLYSTVESIGEGTSGLSQTGTIQSSISKICLSNSIFLELRIENV